MPRQNCNPILNSLLNEYESEHKLFVLDMDSLDLRNAQKESPLASSRLKSMKLNEDLDRVVDDWKLENDFMPSLKCEDYFEVTNARAGISGKRLETYGAENSLFLAVARSILYKVYFIDNKYKSLLRRVYADCLETSGEAQIKFNSDMKLQEALRKSLCTYWLGFVYNGEFKVDCKYSR